MPSPSSALLTQRPDLAESFMEFDEAMDRQGFVANKVFPVVSVASQAGNFGKIPVEQLLQQRDTLRAPGAGYSRGKFTFEPAVYATQEHGAEEVIDDREAQMYADYFVAEQIAAARAYSAVLRNAEQRVADSLFNTSTFTPSAVTNEWDDATNATPLTDVESSLQGIYDASGLWANALIINKKVFRNLRNCDQVIDRIASNGAGNATKPSDISEQMLAQAFGLDMVIVAGSSKNGAAEGQAASISSIWSDEYAMVARVATSVDFKEPCIGRTFHWSQDGSQIGGAVETYRDEAVRGDVVRVRHDVDEVVLYSAAGALLSNITT